MSSVRTIEFKNPSQTDICRIKLSDFLEDKVLSLFETEKKIHRKDLANQFSQRVRFQQYFLWAAVNRLIEKGVLIRSPKSSYLVLKHIEVEHD